MKYIDADLLRERIEKNQYIIEPMFLKGDDSYYEGEYDGFNRILTIIYSLQQEQLDVDIPEEIKKLEFMGSNDARDILHVAKHFYELGLKAK